MGILKFLAKMFSCKSECKFNDTRYVEEFQRATLDEFELKYKDVEKIHRILSKRRRITIKAPRPDTPAPLSIIQEVV